MRLWIKIPFYILTLPIGIALLVLDTVISAFKDWWEIID